MRCDRYDKCTKTDCGMCDEMTQDLINKINVNVGLAQPIKLDEKYPDLIVFEDQPKRRLKTIEETIYSSEKPCERTGECIPSCSYYDPYCGCILGKRYR